MRVTAYLHGSKEAMLDLAERSGLSEVAAARFAYALYEVRLTLDVDERTGDAEIVEVDGRPLGVRGA